MEGNSRYAGNKTEWEFDQNSARNQTTDPGIPKIISKINSKKGKNLGIFANNKITRIKKKIIKEVRRQKNDLTYRVVKIKIKSKFFFEIMQARRAEWNI